VRICEQKRIGKGHIKLVVSQDDVMPGTRKFTRSRGAGVTTIRCPAIWILPIVYVPMTGTAKSPGARVSWCPQTWRDRRCHFFAPRPHL
jgi:hypothetical protein